RVDDRLLSRAAQRRSGPDCRHQGCSTAAAEPNLWLPRHRRPMRPVRPHHQTDRGRSIESSDRLCYGERATAQALALATDSLRTISCAVSDMPERLARFFMAFRMTSSET